ncbi:hypothetical protein [Fundidesulfovibrio butyratiphilus]
MKRKAKPAKVLKMDLQEMIRQRLLGLIGPGKAFENRKQLADAFELDPAGLNNFLKGEKRFQSPNLDRVLEKLNAELVFPEVETVPVFSEGVGKMCIAIIDELRDQIVKSGKFPPDKADNDEEPFDVSAFVVAAFGEGADSKRWTQRVKKPGDLSMVEALAMASAVEKTLDRIVALAEERVGTMKTSPTDVGQPEKPTGTHGE